MLQTVRVLVLDTLPAPIMSFASAVGAPVLQRLTRRWREGVPRWRFDKQSTGPSAPRQDPTNKQYSVGNACSREQALPASRLAEEQWPGSSVLLIPGLVATLPGAKCRTSEMSPHHEPLPPSVSLLAPAAYPDLGLLVLAPADNPQPCFWCADAPARGEIRSGQAHQPALYVMTPFLCQSRKRRSI